MQPPRPKDCRFITFYSYKGGTGRSMLVANVAWLLASNGHRVLAIDWDLEAPGLHRYFQPFLKDKSLSSTDGIIDAVSEFFEAAVLVGTSPDVAEASGPQPELPKPETAPDETPPEDKDWYLEYANLLRYVTPLDWKFPEPGRLDFIGPGRQGPSYGTKVNLFDWEQFYSKFAGAAFLDAAKRFIAEQYDYVTIDSRTGVSDTSGICTMQMPDTLVVCFTLNNQSIEGARAVTAAAQQYRARSSKLKPLITLPVPTRVDDGESELANLGRELARVRFRPFVPVDAKLETDTEKYERTLEEYWGKVEVRYVPKYAYEEVLACFADLPHLSGSILNSAEKLATIITGKSTEMVRLSDQDRAAVLQQFARKPYIVVVADEFVTGLSTKEQPSARRLFTRLVQASPTRGGTTADVASRVSVTDLPADSLSLLDRAIAAKLVKTTGPNDDRYAFLADNRLVSAWPRYREWIERDREFLVWRQRFAADCHTWESSDRKPDDLLTGTSLDEATKWLKARADDLTEREIAFIEASKKADEEVRRAATVEATTPALARRKLSVDWDDKKQLEQDAFRALEDERKTTVRRSVALGAAAFLVLGIAGGLYLSRHVKQVSPPTPPVFGSVEHPSTLPPNYEPSSLLVVNGLRQQLASTLVSLGIVPSIQAGMEISPLDGIRAIDKLIANSKPSDPKVALAEPSRLAFLKGSQPLFVYSPDLKNYVCEHNSYVIAARAGVADITSEVNRWKKQYPLAQAVSEKADDPNSVPIVVSFFVTCEQASKELAKIRKHGSSYGQVPSQGWFTDCPRCVVQSRAQPAPVKIGVKTPPK